MAKQAGEKVVTFKLNRPLLRSLKESARRAQRTVSGQLRHMISEATAAHEAAKRN